MSTSFRSSMMIAVILVTTSSVWAGRGEFSYAAGLPSKKQPIDVVIRRNPFQASSEPERPLPMLRDKDDPVTKLPVLLAGHIRSVIRDPHPLLLIDGLVVQPGDEVRLGRELVLPKHRVVLKAIEEDRLVFHLTSLDPQQPGQVEAVVLLGPSMRKN